MSHPDTADQLGVALRDATSRAVEFAGGGCALLFVAKLDDAESGSARLRAAAGFGSANDARDAAAGILPSVQETIKSRESSETSPPAGLGKRAVGGISIFPIVCRAQAHGALAVGSPSPLEPNVLERLEQLASSTALYLDHARLVEEIANHDSVAPQNENSEEQADEVLKLSEALFAQDIELLRNNEKLGKIEKLKNDFIEKMSRELRTPLNSIIEAIIAVLAGENDKISDQSKSSLRVALDEGTAFQRTLQNILDLWRIKQGELPLEIQEVNVVELVEEAIFSVQDTLTGKPVTIRRDLEASLPKVRTDLTKASQILFLLLDNAAKFTAKGEIVISARVIGGQLVCRICDTGIGICHDDQQLIFDEFFQVDELCSTRYRGAGLGLTLVRDLLILMEGEMLISSEPGSGTEITVRIPVQPV